MKKNILLLFLFIWLQYNFWLGKNNINDLIKIKQDISSQQYDNFKFKERNYQLFAEIYDLNHNLEAIEERSRYDLNMIKSGETFYLLIPKK